MMRINNNVGTVVSRLKVDTSKAEEILKASARSATAASSEDTVTISERAKALAEGGFPGAESARLKKIGQLDNTIQDQRKAADFSTQYGKFLEQSDFQEGRRRKAIVDRIPTDLGPRLNLNNMQPANDAVTGNMQSLNNSNAALRSVQGSSTRAVSNSLFM